jgi:uncharacterized membrane protein HdeD (DUF308 family)
MESERPAEALLTGRAPWRLHSWKASFAMGLVTLILGVILAFRPSGSLVVISVLIGILMIFSGIFHIIAALDGPEDHRVWRALAGVVFIVGGIVFIRHLQFSLALIGLIVGFSWVIQGVSSLIGGITHRGGMGGWSVFFGIVSLIAGIVVISTPVVSIAVLATFLGIWFAVIGVFEMVDAFMSRHAWDQAATGQVNVPGQRAQSEAADSEAADTEAAGGQAGGSAAAGRNVQG